jgi:hypothetical protein
MINMKATSIIEPLLIMCLLFTCDLCVAQKQSFSSKVDLNLQYDLVSTNGTVRYHLAEKLSFYHDKKTFEALLKLLTDADADVSYAAAESIEARGDSSYAADLISTIRTLPRDNIWPAYWAARSYPTNSMLDFLTQRLKEEILFQHRRVNFDGGNCDYLSQSLAQIMHSLYKNIKIAAPEDDKLESYQNYLQNLQILVKRNL